MPVVCDVLIGRTNNVPSNRKRHKADVCAAPAWMLQRGAEVTAGGAARAPAQLVARRVRAPSDDAGGHRERRVVLASFAVEPHPFRRSLQVAEGRACTGHGGRMTPYFF